VQAGLAERLRPRVVARGPAVRAIAGAGDDERVVAELGQLTGGRDVAADDAADRRIVVGEHQNASHELP
jgi:hypothetical protein